MIKKIVTYFLVFSVIVTLAGINHVKIFAEESSTVALTTQNFPDSHFLEYLRQFDTNNDEVLDATELQQISVLYVDKNVKDLTGVNLLKHVGNISITGSIIDTLTIDGLENLTSLSISRSSHVVHLNLSNLPQFTNLFVEYAGLSSLEFKNTPEVSRISTPGNELENLDVSQLSKLTTLDISHNPITDFDHLKLNLTSLSNLIVNEFKDFSALKYFGDTILEISNKLTIPTVKTYDEATNTFAFPVKLPEGFNISETFDMFTFNGDRIVADEKFEANKSTFVRKTNNKIALSLSLDLEDRIKPMNDWISIQGSFTRLENYVRDNMEYEVYRKLISGGNIHFSNFFVQPKIQSLNTYVYQHGSSSTARAYIKYGENDEVNNYLDHSNAEYSYKYINGKLYLRTIISGMGIELEEISYISDFGSVEHTLNIKNTTNNPLINFQLRQQLDTELNGFDHVPVIAYGKKSTYIESSRFFMGIEAGENSEMYVGTYSDPYNSKPMANESHGTVLVKDRDTAIFYTSPVMTLEPNVTFTMKYRENFYYKEEKPTFKELITAKSLTIYEGDSWKAQDHFVIAKNASGEPVAFEMITTKTLANPNVAGVYDITFMWNDVQETVQLTVLKKEVIKPVEPTVVEPTKPTVVNPAEPVVVEPPVKTQDALAIKPQVDTNDNLTLWLVMIVLSVLGLRKFKK